MATRTCLGSLICAFLFAPGMAAAGDGTHSLEELVIEIAHSPADHVAIATHYRAKADEARADMRRHEAMRRVYSGGKQGTRAGGFHGKRLAARFGDIAAEYDELAKLHDAEATKAK
jgi:hypothetical protein